MGSFDGAVWGDPAHGRAVHKPLAVQTTDRSNRLGPWAIEKKDSQEQDETGVIV